MKFSERLKDNFKKLKGSMKEDEGLNEYNRNDSGIQSSSKTTSDQSPVAQEIDGIRPLTLQEAQSSFEPYKEDIKNSGATSHKEVLDHLLRMHKMYDQNPHVMVASIIKHHGMKLNDLLPYMSPDDLGKHDMEPQGKVIKEVSITTSPSDDDGDEISPEMQRMIQEEQKNFEDFQKSGDRKHFEKVMPMMRSILTDPELSSHGDNLNDAYENATWAHPEVRKEMLYGMMKEKNATRAMKSSGSLKSEGIQEPVKKKKPMTISERLIEASRKM